MSQHTPGPWAVGYGSKICAVYMKKLKDGWLVRDQVAKFARSPEGEANARLIAAAPDLLAALREIETICTESAGDCRRRMGTRLGNVRVVLETAITKATGDA